MPPESPVPPPDAEEARLARRAAAQRGKRTEGARLAGVLAHHAQHAVAIGLEHAAVAAFSVASATLEARFGLTPHTPGPRAEA